MMFIKNTGKLESFIGVNSSFKGNVNTEGALRIDGIMEGNVNADWVVLGEKASFKGDIIARGIIVGGRVEGNPKAKEIVEIKSKGQVLGDISAIRLLINNSGVFNGSVKMDRDETKVVEFQAKEKQAKNIQG